MRIYIGVNAPHRWARVNRQGAIRREGVAQSLKDVPIKPRSDEIWAVLPGEDLLTIEVAVPARNRRKLKLALPYALEEQLTEDIDAFHFSILRWKPGQSAVAGVLSRRKVNEWRTLFDSNGLRIQGMVAEYQLLPIHPRSSMTIAEHDDGRTSILQANGSGATLDSETLELWWESLDGNHLSVAVNQESLARKLMPSGAGEFKEWNIGDNFAQWIVHRTRSAELVNVLPREDSSDKDRVSVPGLRVAVVLIALAVLGRLGLDAYEYLQLERKHRQLSNEIKATFQKAFPEEKRIVNARSQLRQKLVELSRGANSTGEFQTLLVVVASAASARGTNIEEVSFKANSMEVLCSVKNFADLDVLQKRFAKPGMKVELVASGSLENRVTGRFRLSRGEG